MLLRADLVRGTRVVAGFKLAIRTVEFVQGSDPICAIVCRVRSSASGGALLGRMPSHQAQAPRDRELPRLVRYNAIGVQTVLFRNNDIGLAV